MSIIAVGVKMKGSQTQFKTDALRRKHTNYTCGLWTVWEMSNRQVLIKFGATKQNH